MDWSSVPIAVFYLICAIIGIVGNGIMIVVFIEEKKFKLPCNYMITLNCLADTFHVCGHFVFNYHLFTNTTSSQAQCFYMLSLTIAGYCISGPLLLAMGVDRLFACKYPVLYRSALERPKIYLMLQLATPVVFTAICLYLANKTKDDETQIICMAPLAMSRASFQVYTYSSNFINLLIVLVYLRAFFVLKYYSARGASKMKSIFKSISITVIIVLLGWTTVTFGNTLALTLIENRSIAELVSIHVGIGVNISCSCNVFVFYTINSDYRQAIKQLFKLKPDEKLLSTSSEAQTNNRKRLSYPAIIHVS